MQYDRCASYIVFTVCFGEPRFQIYFDEQNKFYPARFFISSCVAQLLIASTYFWFIAKKNYIIIRDTEMIRISYSSLFLFYELEKFTVCCKLCTLPVRFGFLYIC